MRQFLPPPKRWGYPCCKLINENVGVKKIVDLDKYNKFIDAFNDLNNIEKLQKELKELEKELIKRQKGDSYCTDIYSIQHRIEAQKEVIKNLQAIRDRGYKTVEEMLTITDRRLRKVEHE
ncbi:MAG: hypothetical protein WAP06_03165 [Defluviitoga tunisiensis]